MSEKKQVIYDLRVTYSGPFIVEDLYKEVQEWVKEKGLEIEPKKKMEHVAKNGKRVEWLIEAHKRLDHYHHSVIVLRVLMDNVREISIKREGKKIRINNGDIFVNVDGFIQAHVHGSFYQTKPVYYMVRALIDFYIYNFWSFKLDGAVSSDCHDLFKRIRSFFQLQKYKYE